MLSSELLGRKEVAGSGSELWTAWGIPMIKSLIFSFGADAVRLFAGQAR